MLKASWLRGMDRSPWERGNFFGVANAVAFLSSTVPASFVTGQELVVYGGMIPAQEGYDVVI
jgi:NAD(P)-dependent dehydrogenase (short-subunit alcohol dehydrogenase family)